MEAYSGAKAAIAQQRPEQALALADIARTQASDPLQLSAARHLRILALFALREDAKLIEEVEAALASDCLEPAQAGNLQMMLDEARKRLIRPSSP